MAKKKANENMQEKNLYMNKGDDVDFGKTQTFLANAITDISGYIRFLDTKVSIVMTALGVIIAGIINCRDLIVNALRKCSNCSWIYIFFHFIIIIFLISTVLVYYWGLQTIKSHFCNIDFKSLWFIKEGKEEYSFDNYRIDVEKMTSQDIVDTMAAELYKLNNINKQKLNTMHRVINSFGLTLLSLLAGIFVCTVLNI